MNGFKKETTSNVETTDAPNAHSANRDGDYRSTTDPGIYHAVPGLVKHRRNTKKSRFTGFFYYLNMPPPTLTEALFVVAVQKLCQQDSGLAEIVDSVGPPPFWIRQAGFPTLIQIILEQQVSLASAQATFDRLNALAGKLTPERMLELDDQSLRTAGFSRQKSRYCRIAAQAVIDGSLNLDGLMHLNDDTARSALTALTGIGPWTADVYLQMALRRPDIWPIGDVALQAAVKKYAGLPKRPKGDEMEQYGEKWRPLRTVAASILWHGYLNLPTEAYR